MAWRSLALAIHPAWGGLFGLHPGLGSEQCAHPSPKAETLLWSYECLLSVPPFSACRLLTPSLSFA